MRVAVWCYYWLMTISYCTASHDDNFNTFSVFLKSIMDYGQRELSDRMNSLKLLYIATLILLCSACTGGRDTPAPTLNLEETPKAVLDQPPTSQPTQTLLVPPTATPHLSDTFAKTMGGPRRDRGINLLQTNNGDFVIVGSTRSQGAGQEDVYLVRLNPQGEPLWENTYGGTGSDNGWAAMETDDGGFLIVGFTDSFGAGEMDVYLLSTDAEGELLWERTYGGPNSEYGWAMAKTDDGGYVLAGQTNSFGTGQEDGYLIKVNAQGEEIWSQTFGEEQEDRLFSIDQTADSGFILTGTTRSYGARERNLYLVKTDPSGEMDWMQIYGEDRDDVGHSVRLTADDGFIVTGYTKSFGASNYDTWLIKTDRDGNSEWQKFFGGPSDDRTISGEQTSDGGYILTGYTRGFGAVRWDVFLVKTDASGEVVWYKTFGGNADDTGYTVIQSSDNGFILTGETNSFGEGQGDMYIIKVDPGGELIE